jgi:hypothetical protein
VHNNTTGLEIFLSITKNLGAVDGQKFEFGHQIFGVGGQLATKIKILL